MEHELRPRSPTSAPLVVSALPAEQRPLRRLLRAPLRGERWRRPDRGRTIFGVVTGDGPQRARAGLEAALHAFGPSMIVVVGLGGGLDPTLRSEDLVWVRRIRDGRHPEIERSVAGPPLGWVRPGTAVTVREIVDRADDKERLWHRLGRPGGAVVDLESLIYARLADDWDLPLVVCRAVSDPAGESLPSIIRASVDDRGSVRPLHVAGRALVRPQTWPQLARLGRRLQRASEKLADAVLPLLAGE